MLAKKPSEKIINILEELILLKNTNEQEKVLIVSLKAEIYKVKFVEPKNNAFFSIQTKQKIMLLVKNFLDDSIQENSKEIINLIIELRTLETEG